MKRKYKFLISTTGSSSKGPNSSLLLLRRFMQKFSKKDKNSLLILNFLSKRKAPRKTHHICFKTHLLSPECSAPMFSTPLFLPKLPIKKITQLWRLWHKWILTWKTSKSTVKDWRCSESILLS